MKPSAVKFALLYHLPDLGLLYPEGITLNKEVVQIIGDLSIGFHC